MLGQHSVFELFISSSFEVQAFPHQASHKISEFSTSSSILQD